MGKSYSQIYYERHKEKVLSKNYEWQRNHREWRRKWDKKNYPKVREARLAKAKEYHQRLRQQVFNLLGEKCIYCGCSDLDFLELNYKAGGHSKLVKQNKLNTGYKLYRDILKGRISPNLFEVTCRPHNAVYYLLLKYGDKAKSFSIKWLPA